MLAVARRNAWGTERETNVQGQPQCLRKAMMVGLSSGSVRFGCAGALAPISGGGLTSFFGSVLRDSHSWAKDIFFSFGNGDAVLNWVYGKDMQVIGR